MADDAATAASCRVDVVLVGDSVLDSGIWVTHAEQNAAYFLQADHGLTVDDYSTDGNRIVDVGDASTGAPRRPFVWHRRIAGLAPYRDVPVDALPASDLTVLSLGGNDVLHCLRRVRLTKASIMRDLECRRVRERYEAIVGRMAERGGKLVLVAPYMPNRRDPLGKALAPLMTSVAREVMPNWYYALARRYGAVVVDLSLSFDPYNDQLYGSTAIEPSELGARRIAALIAFAKQDVVRPGSVVRWGARGRPEVMMRRGVRGGEVSTEDYPAALAAHLDECRRRPRAPIPVERSVWKVLRTMYFQSLLVPLHIGHAVVLKTMTRVIDDKQERCESKKI